MITIDSSFLFQLRPISHKTAAGEQSQIRQFLFNKALVLRYTVMNFPFCRNNSYGFHNCVVQSTSSL